MSVIFPGNYVAHLNAYREQGCVALPGVEFYRAVGALVLNPDNDSVTNAGTLALGTYDLQILSPDLRQDDKPRKDKPFVIPTGSVVYRTAVSAPGVKATAAGNTVIVAPSGSSGFPATPTLTAGDNLFFDAAGVSSALDNILGGTATTGDVQVQVTTNAAFTAAINPSAGADRNAPSAILVEVCYYRAAPAPDTDDVSIPYAIEAGQGY
jgi:hypothetical protein